MHKIIDIKEFSRFLRVHRNEIVVRWLDKSEVQNILHKHSLPIVDKNTHIFYDFCDCFISIFEWDFTIAQCQVRTEFLALLNNYNISTNELFTLILRLNTTIEEILFKNGNLSYNLQIELDTVALEIANELTTSYERLSHNDGIYKNEHTNLLSEYKKAVDLSNIVSKTNPKGIITYVNDKFCQISGYTKEELIGKPHNIIRHPSMSREAFKDLWDTIKAKRPWNGVVTNMAKDGSSYVVDTSVVPILDVDGDIVEYIAVRHDITELEKTKEQLRNINKAMKNKVDELYSMTSILEEKATKDLLTKIYNRVKFEEIFFDEIEKSKKYRQSLSLIIFDLDHFKKVNDTYGHQVGDSILVELSELITKNIKTSDVFARWGGEEFVILLPNTDLDGSLRFSEKLRRIVANNNFVQVGTLTASFGVGQLEEYEDKLTFFEKVDKALYVAKHNGRNRVEKALFNCVY